MRVLGGIEQGHVGMLRADVAQIVHGGIGVELGDVTHAEFREFGGVMAEPFAQEGRGATSFSHRSNAARSFVMPRGHRRPPAPDTRPTQSALHIYRLIAIPIRPMIGVRLPEVKGRRDPSTRSISGCSV